jgi:hypothetical protein
MSTRVRKTRYRKARRILKSLTFNQMPPSLEELWTCYSVSPKPLNRVLNIPTVFEAVYFGFGRSLGAVSLRKNCGVRLK